MPLLGEVHAIGVGVDSGTPLPAQSIVVTMPTPGPENADSGGQAAIFGDEAYFYARCLATDAVGACVFANSTVAFVSTADANNPNPVVGIIVAKAGSTSCTVQRYGESAINYANLVTGKRYFLGNNGGILPPPFPDDVPQFVQQVGNAISSTKLFIQPTGTVIRRQLEDGGAVATFNTLLNGIGVPALTVGRVGDFYVDTLAEMLYGPKTADAWGDGVQLIGPQGPRGAMGPRGDFGPAGPRGEAGPAGDVGPRGPEGVGSQGEAGPAGEIGPAGPAGPIGERGQAGPAIIGEFFAPVDSAGADGDYWYDRSKAIFYGPKSDGEWPRPGVSLQGKDGQDGKDGTSWFHGDGPPDPNTTYPAGSYYLDETNGRVYPPA